jgi:hypothetical protein
MWMTWPLAQRLRRHRRSFSIAAVAAVAAIAVMSWLTAPRTVSARRCDPVPSDDPRKLIVLVPAFHQTTAEWTDLGRELAAGIPEYASARWLCIDHHLKFWTRGRLDDVAHSVRDRIDEEWAKARGERVGAEGVRAKGYDEIVLIGHSVGGLLVRQAYLLAAGAERTENITIPWAPEVRQLVLFASVNRGADIAAWGWPWRLGVWLVDLLPMRLVSLDTRRGSDFIASLRINWIRHFRPHRKRHGACRASIAATRRAVSRGPRHDRQAR